MLYESSWAPHMAARSVWSQFTEAQMGHIKHRYVELCPVLLLLCLVCCVLMTGLGIGMLTEGPPAQAYALKKEQKKCRITGLHLGMLAYQSIQCHFYHTLNITMQNTGNVPC